MPVLRRVWKVELRELVNLYLPLYLLIKNITLRFYVVRILFFSLLFLAFSNYLEVQIFCLKLMFVEK